MIDSRREVENIYRQLDRYQAQIGESVIWFKFDVDGSEYDRVYDEGNRVYLPGRPVPILWVDQIEATENYTPEGRRPTQRIRLAVSSRAINEAGIGAAEAHGGRTWDTKPLNDEDEPQPWWDDRLNDVFYYDGRYYEVSNFQIRGRSRHDVIIGVSGIETQPDDERVFDLPIGA